ncbi:hypothetical protein [Maricaulis sp. CAU 1757]
MITTALKRSYRSFAIQFGVGVTIVLVLAFSGELGLIDRDLARRGSGLGFAVLMILAGNMLPKVTGGLSAGAMTPGVARLAGWSFVLAGLTTVLVWLVAPDGVVKLAAGGVGLAAFAVSLGAAGFALVVSGPPVAADKGEEPDRVSRSMLFALLLLMHALVWVCAIFLIDALWGDTAGQWSALAFVLANGVLAIRFAGLFKSAADRPDA